MLRIVEADSYYGQSRVLHGLTLGVRPGEFVAILGRNGTGKTTLLKTLMGLTNRQTGKIVFNDRDLSNFPTYQRARAGIAYVPQGREIIAEFSVRENILMGAFARRDGRRAITDLVCELFPYLTDNPNRLGGLLSGGQQQQLAIARALTAEPDILLLHEPTEGIQPNLVEEIEEVIIQLNRSKHLTIILVEQNLSFARRATDRFAILEKGRVVAAGPTAQLSEEVVHRHLAI
jgi:urea transport system ATP-binding protein